MTLTELEMELLAAGLDVTFDADGVLGVEELRLYIVKGAATILAPNRIRTEPLKTVSAAVNKAKALLS